MSTLISYEYTELQLVTFDMEAWFGIAESRFRLHNIEDEQVKFDLVINALPKESRAVSPNPVAAVPAAAGVAARQPLALLSSRPPSTPLAVCAAAVLAVPCAVRPLLLPLELWQQGFQV